MNKIKIKEENNLTLSEGEYKEIYLYTVEDYKKTYNLNDNSHLIIYHYNINSNVNIEINLNGEHAEVEYHFSTINYDNNKLNMNIKHNCQYTISNVFNHGVNIKDKELIFNIHGEVLKDIKGCMCNQENQIINLENGKSIILPKLLIDNYEVISAHSAYIGKFKDEILFYLMSRGLSVRKANELLIKGLLINNGNINKEELLKFQKEIEKI